MRIAYICADPGVPVFGHKGCSVHVQEMVRTMLRSGADVDLFATRFGQGPPEDLKSLRLHQIPSGSAHAVGGLNGGIERELRKADTAGVAAACTPPFDLVYERYSLWSYAGIDFARRKRVPAILEVNAPLIEEQAQHRGLLDRKTAEEIAQRVFGQADVILAVSEEVAAYLAAYLGTTSKIRVVPNGVDPTRFPDDLQPDRPRSPAEFVVGFVGTLKPWHGLEVLADGFARFRRIWPAARLLIVGDGPGKDRLLEELDQAGLRADAHLTGIVAPEKVPGLIASMDVAVAPAPKLNSYYFSPLKLFEYMAAGRPVIAAQVGQLAQVVQDGVTGLLVPPGDAEALAGAFERLARAPALREQMGRAGRQIALRDYTWNAVWERVLEAAERQPRRRGVAQRVAFTAIG